MSTQEELEFPRWLIDHPVYDPGVSFCSKCAEAIAESSGEHVLVDGGWLIECDQPEACHECGEPLGGTMLPDGFLIDSMDTLREWNEANPE